MTWDRYIQAFLRKKIKGQIEWLDGNKNVINNFVNKKWIGFCRKLTHWGTAGRIKHTDGSAQRMKITGKGYEIRSLVTKWE